MPIFIYVAWLGSLSLFRVALTLGRNLLEPCLYKLKRYRDFKKKQGSRDPLPTAPPAAPVGDETIAPPASNDTEGKKVA